MREWWCVSEQAEREGEGSLGSLPKSQALSKTRGGSHVQRNALVPVQAVLSSTFQYAPLQVTTTEFMADVQVIAAAPVTFVHAADTKTNAKQCQSFQFTS